MARGTSRSVVDGKVAVVSGTAQDITARKQAETESRRNACRNSNATLDSTADGILVVSTAGLITNLNEQFASLFGLAEDSSLPPVSREELLSIVLPQVKDPDTFMRRVDDVAEHPKSRSEDDRRAPRWAHLRVLLHAADRVDGRDRRASVERARHHRAHPVGDRTVPSGLPRLAHRPGQQGTVQGPRRPRARASGTRACERSPCCSSISTSSRPSTTASGTPPVTSCSSPSPNRFRSCLRPGDTAARLGGDEFAFLIEDVDERARRGGDRAAVARRRSRSRSRSGTEMSTSAPASASPRPDAATRRSTPAQRRPRHVRGEATAARTGSRRSRPESPVRGARQSSTSRRRCVAASTATSSSFTTSRSSTSPPVQIVGAEALARWNSAERGPIGSRHLHPSRRGHRTDRRTRRSRADGRVHAGPPNGSSSTVRGAPLLDQRQRLDRAARRSRSSSSESRSPSTTRASPPNNLVLEITETRRHARHRQEHLAL